MAKAAVGIKSSIWLESSPGSVVSSTLIHALICAAVVVVVNRVPVTVEAPVTEMELGYEVLEEAPVQVKIKPAPIVEEELQDQKSEVVGTKTAVVPTPNSGGESKATTVDIPYYKIKPKYPRAALVSGEEGWILLKIDVTETGEVTNVRVVDGIKRNLFQDEARRAVEKWKYRPATDSEGAAIPKPDHLVRVDFKLTDA